MKVFVNVPFFSLEKYSSRLKQLGVGPELYVSAEAIEKLRSSHVKKFLKILYKDELECTVHTPYLDLNLGALDKDVLKISRYKIEKAVKVAVDLGAIRCVIHSFYDDYRYDFKVQKWLDVMAESIEKVLEITNASKTAVVVENVFDRDPVALSKLCRIFRGRLWICFDPAHANLFYRVEWNAWLSALGRYTIHMHMHDNNGERDQHLPPGRGMVPYVQHLRKLAGFKNLTITCEPHKEAHVLPMIKFARRWFKEAMEP